MEQYVIYFDVISALILTTMIVANIAIPTYGNVYEKIYRHILIVVDITCISDLLSALLLMYPLDSPYYYVLTYAVTWIYFAAHILTPFYFTIYLYAYLSKNMPPLKNMLVIAFPVAVCEFIMLFNCFTGWVFNIVDGQSVRGPLLTVFYLVMLIYFILDILIIYNFRKNVDKPINVVFVVYCILSLASMCIQFFFPRYLVQCTAMTMILLLIHYSIQNKNMIENEVQKEREVKEAAEIANKVKSKFISDMSHDIRTPMNAIIGMSEIAKTEIENKDQAMKCLDVVLTSAHHLMALMNNIIEMNDLDVDEVVLDLKPTSIKKCIDSVADMAKSFYEAKNQQLVINYHDIDDVMIIADSMRLEQIFLEIVTNASEYMTQGNKTVIDVYYENKNNKACYNISVIDEGKGISAEFVDKVFVPFSREYNSTDVGISGLGLGLAIVKKLMDAMGAQIDIESRVNVGTGVHMKFAFDIDNTPGVQVKQVSDEKSTTLPLEGKYVQIVDDNEINLKVLSKLVRRAGAKVITSINGEDALNKIKSISLDRIDLIFMDLQMPVMNGFEATKRIREIEAECMDRKIPIYAVTANTSEEDCKAAYESGVDGIIAKPVRYETLIEALEGGGVI